MTYFVKIPAFALHIAMVGQKLDFDKMIKQTLPIVLYRSHSLKEFIMKLPNQFSTYQITFPLSQSLET